MKSMYVHSLASVKIKGDDSNEISAYGEWENGRRRENRISPGLLYADDARQIFSESAESDDRMFHLNVQKWWM